MLENFTYDGKKRLPLPKNYLQPSVKLPKFSWHFFSWWTSSMNNFSWYVYLKKSIIVVIVDKLIYIYFTWFVHNFVNHKYNFLLKRNDMCLMPLNTFVCLSFTSIRRQDFICLEQLQCQVKINDVVLKTFLSSAKSPHRYFSTESSHFILFTH